jgi:EmrB/QacA subfamily drug resistance transporter
MSMPHGVLVPDLDSHAYRWRWWALIGASLAVFMAALDSNVVAVALPVMARGFKVTSEIRWVTLAYIIPTTTLLGAFGALSDAIGRKRVTLIGVGVFILGSILCGTAQNLGQMIVYRVLQGIGGACIGSAIIAIATVNFAPEERGRAMAVVGLIAPLGAVVGPSVGGLLVGALGWPSIFYINVPFGIVSFILIIRLLPRDSTTRLKAFDLAGAAAFTAALCLLILGLAPSNGRLTSTDFLLLAGFALAVAGLVVIERRAAAHAILPPSLVRRGSFTIPLSGIMTMGIVGAGLGFVLPFYLEVTLGMSPSRAGLTLLFMPLVMAITSQVGGRLADRFHPRLPAAVGAAVSLVGIGLLLPLGAGWQSVDVALRLAVIGLGFGFFVSPSSVAVMAATPRDHVGVGGAMVNTARFLGFTLGPTLATVFWNPGLQGLASLSAMRTVLILLTVVQALTLATVLGYRTAPDKREAKPDLESSSTAA